MCDLFFLIFFIYFLNFGVIHRVAHRVAHELAHGLGPGFVYTLGTISHDTLTSWLRSMASEEKSPMSAIRKPISTLTSIS